MWWAGRWCCAGTDGCSFPGGRLLRYQPPLLHVSPAGAGRREGAGSSARPAPMWAPALPHWPSSRRPREGFRALPAPLPRLPLHWLAVLGSAAAPEPPRVPLPGWCPPAAVALLSARPVVLLAAAGRAQSPAPPPLPRRAAPALPALEAGAPAGKGALGPAPTTLGGPRGSRGAAEGASATTKSCYLGPACACPSLCGGWVTGAPGQDPHAASPRPAAG